MGPEDYVPLFQRLGVSAVVRFNKKMYDERHFTKANIHHFDLFYEDGGNPTEEVMQRFVKLCEKEKGAVAVSEFFMVCCFVVFIYIFGLLFTA